MTPTLYIGNKNYSSWSLRPWLALKWGEIAFDEVLIQLGGEGYGQGLIAAVRAVSPTGKVPCLTVGDLTVWDSLAICEWAAENARVPLWPEDPRARAVARAVSAEMHSSFSALRNAYGMNLRRRTQGPAPTPAVAADLARIDALWCETRARWGAAGPFLFGQRSIADAFFTPVATRLRSYGATLSPVADAYRDTLLADANFRAWEAAGVAEAWTIPATDAL